MKHHELPRVLRRAVGLMRFAREAVGARASSLFLADLDRTLLRGLVSEWDWTRTSFPSELARWPTVLAALEDGDVRFISAADARGAESEWFETRGITSTLCVPMRSGNRSLGVLFFDFDGRTEPLGKVEAALLRDVGRRCARAMTRAQTAALPEADPRWIH